MLKSMTERHRWILGQKSLQRRWATLPMTITILMLQVRRGYSTLELDFSTYTKPKIRQQQGIGQDELVWVLETLEVRPSLFDLLDQTNYSKPFYKMPMLMKTFKRYEVEEAWYFWVSFKSIFLSNLKECATCFGPIVHYTCAPHLSWWHSIDKTYIE